MEGSCREGRQAPTAGTPDRAAYCESKKRCPAPEITACNAPNNDRHTPAREGMDNANISANSDSQKEPSLTEDHEAQDQPSVRNMEESGASSKDGHANSPAFVTARSVLARNLKEAFLSPRFRSVVAMAGWDDESLLMASQADDTCLDTNTDAEEGPRLTSVRSPGALEQSPQGVVLDSKKIRDRKREVRTPQQAITPLSAGRRHRRPRRQAIHGCPAEVLPIGDLSLNQEFQTGIVSERDDANELATGKADGSSEGEAAPSDNLGDTATESKSSVAETPTCFDQLREELSCAVCLDVCFEPSTTSCGHSFCRGCLRSVLQRCGPRCPKCRQQLKGDAWRSCPVNTVLWNTVQILFAGEVRDRAAASRQEEEEAEAEKQRRRRSQEEEGNARGPSRVAWQSARVRAAGLRRTRAGAASAVAHVVEVAEERPARRTGNARVVQEQVDAALARRLQRAELVNSSASSALSMVSAAANLRAVAYSAVRGYRRFH